jgi:6-phosphogluconolactonase (cycloisomerase 2 family)
MSFGIEPAASDDRIALYAAVNDVVHHYEVDVDDLSLHQRGAIVAPARVQYAWPDRGGTVLYVASSDGGPGRVGTTHALSAFLIDPVTGALDEHGAAVAIPERPIHVSLTNDGRYALVTFNGSAMIEVYRINRDGTVGQKVEQPHIDAGVYAHQARQADDGVVISVGLGNPPKAGKLGDPGTLSTFSHAGGMLTRIQRLVMDGNLGLRHLDFSADQSRVHVVVERGNKLLTYGFADGRLTGEPIFVADTLANPEDAGPGQHAGTLHRHPNGKVLYIANRASMVRDVAGVEVFAGGENSIAVFALDEITGAPRLVQAVDTTGFEARTFSIDPSGRMMVVGNQMPLDVSRDGKVTAVPASLAVFGVREDGTLAFVRSYLTDAETGRPMFWTGMVAR